MHKTTNIQNTEALQSSLKLSKEELYFITDQQIVSDIIRLREAPLKKLEAIASDNNQPRLIRLLAIRHLIHNSRSLKQCKQCHDFAREFNSEILTFEAIMKAYSLLR